MEKGKIIYPEIKDYTSHNAKRLTVAEIKEILLKLDEVNKFL